MRKLNLILLAVATLFLAGMLNELGWTTLGRYFLQVGYYWPLLLVPYGFVHCLGTISWSFLLPDKATRPSWRSLFLLRVAGESLNQLTPTATMGGEFFRATRLKDMGVRWEEATASVVIQKGILVLSLVLYSLLGLGITALMLTVSISSLGMLALAAAVMGIAGLAFLAVQRKGPCVTGVRILEKCRLCPAKLKEKEQELARLDSCLAGFYREHPYRGLLALVILFAGWLVQGAETYMIFRLIGHPTNYAVALSLDALVMLFASLGFMIPASVGVQDGGAVLVSLGLNLGAALGGAFTIMRRIREAFWLSLGLLVAARQK